MKRATLFVGLLTVSPLFAASVTEISDAGCIGLNDPWGCCETNPPHDCDGRTVFDPLWYVRLHTEIAELYWDRECGDDFFYEDWPGPSGLSICTAAEVAAGTKIKNAVGTMQECTQARIDDMQCRQDFLGQDVPKKSQAFKVSNLHLQLVARQARQQGAGAHALRNATPLADPDPDP